MNYLHKKILLTALLPFLLVPLFSAENKLFILSEAGYDSIYDDAFVSLGIELNMNKSLFVQFLISSDFNDNGYPYPYWDDDDYYDSNLYSDFRNRITLSISTNNIFGVQILGGVKVPLFDHWHLFSRAGFHINYHSSSHHDFDYDFNSAANPELRFGFLLGGGIKYNISERAAILAGVNYNWILDNDSNPGPCLKRLAGTKVFFGIAYSPSRKPKD